MIRTLKLGKWGNSNAVRLPKEILNQVGIASTDNEVSVETTADSIIIKPKKEKSTLEKMFENYDGKSYPFEIVDKGGAVGQELI
ncbi:AbrB/MazE/SpoVT family DNA-binding domain-containing protein [Limosilactobacillus fastidiosus]|uniref:AbrB/MazE/SpoVT family DNA-binding domain-containing protein n=1 Tax=Limosilactobacillus fastidiosus TaxID=2759855 RepID=A0ABR6E8X7_9LACO|nr:AbrB/MazE/SpoVT family DNA-binding domain-containing protein [Limosilactobacillus fastidiosus]MBB1063656.1 AbrB/MazE/SpoVT family DNA-binding domain-containing protein [Limosilactobacillus fastidiosus]MCD7084231.1 AbrB/MazE/SpoVT family DNA-binding domain-containing protein [Limosilactobacillus fastidiosus]